MVGESFLGMVGTDSWSDSDFRPKDWNAKLFRQFPNGMLFQGANIGVPITGLSELANEGKELSIDPHFYWFEKDLADQKTTITAATDIFTDSAMANALLVSTSAQYTILYVKVAEAFAKQCVAGYQLMLMDTSDLRAANLAVIQKVELNGASSKLTMRIMEADTTVNAYSLLSVDAIEIAGSSFAEGSNMPEAVHYDPVKYDNYTDIHKNAISQTGTALATTQRVDNDYSEDEMEQGFLHGYGIEKALIWGVKFERTGDNAQPHRGSWGLYRYLKAAIVRDSALTYQLDDYRQNAAHGGQSWVSGGSNWIDDFLVQFSVYSQEAMVPCGNFVIQAINKLARHIGWEPLHTNQVLFGIKVHTWDTPYMQLHFMPYPPFVLQPAYQRLALICNPTNFRKRFLKGRNTQFVPDVDFDQNRNAANRPDAKREGWYTECGYEIHHPKQLSFLNGFGVDND